MAHEANIPAQIVTGIPVYGVLALLGFVFALIYTYIEWNKKGLRKWDYIQVVSFTTVGALYGAKLWYMIFDPLNAFSSVQSVLDLLIVVFIPATGRSIIGTVVFVPLSIWGVSKYNPDVKFRQTIDILLPAVLIGQFVARWGNFANHSVFGQAVDELPVWLPSWIKNNMLITLDKETAYRQPLFLYESLIDLMIFLFITMFVKNLSNLKQGTAGASYIMTYGMFRAIFEPMRNTEYIMHWGPIPTSLITALILFVVGLYMIYYFNFISE